MSYQDEIMTIKLKSEGAKKLIEELEHNDFIQIINTEESDASEFSIPEWQKEIVRYRLKNDSDRISWEDLKSKLSKKWGT
jgi:hypothetical protein